MVQEKFIEPYKVELNKINGELMLVIQPKLIYNSTQYIHELDTIAKSLNEHSLEMFVRRYFQKTHVHKRGIATAIFIPLQE